MALLVGAVPSAASARPPTNLRVPAHPRRVVITTEGFPGWLGMRMVAAATGEHLDRNDILANADCRDGVFAVFAKIPPPIVHHHHTRLFSPHCAFLPALPSASRIPCQPRLPPINVDPTVFVATWRAASRFRNRVALPKHRIAYPLRVAYPPLALHFPSASRLSPPRYSSPPFFSARFTFLPVAFFYS